MTNATETPEMANASNKTNASIIDSPALLLNRPIIRLEGGHTTLVLVDIIFATIFETATNTTLLAIASAPSATGDIFFMNMRVLPTISLQLGQNITVARTCENGGRDGDHSAATSACMALLGRPGCSDTVVPMHATSIINNHSDSANVSIPILYCGCPVGSRGEAQHSLKCTACKSGRFLGLQKTRQGETGPIVAVSGPVAGCVDCALGKFNAAPGQSRCYTCAASTFADRLGTVACTPCPENLHITRYSSEYHISRFNCSREVIVDPVAEQEKLDAVVQDGVRRESVIGEMQVEYRLGLEEVSRNASVRSHAISSQIDALDARAAEDHHTTESLQLALAAAQTTIAALSKRMETLEKMVQRIDGDCLVDKTSPGVSPIGTRRRRLGGPSSPGDPGVAGADDGTDVKVDVTEGLRDITVLHPCYRARSVALGGFGSGGAPRGLEGESVAILTVFSVLILFTIGSFVLWRKAKNDPEVAKALANIVEHWKRVHSRCAERARQSWDACCFWRHRCHYRCARCRHGCWRCCFVHCFTD
jgi:hypothetical protein